MVAVAHLVTAALLNSLWEAAVLAFVVWALLRIVRNANATTRYCAWCVALIASVVLPVVTAWPKVTTIHAPAAALTDVSPIVRAGPPHRAAVAIVRAASSSAVNVAPAPRPTTAARAHAALTIPASISEAIAGVWAAFVLVLLIRLGISLWRLERLKADALPLPLEYREQLARWTIAEKGARAVRLCMSDEIDVPIAVGLFDSMILIPKHLLDTLTTQEIDQVMLHELGHLRRADDWTNGFERIAQALLFFNPAVRYIAQQVDLEREVACDDWVLAETQSVRPYAQCLTKMAEVTAWPHRPLAAPGVFVTRRGLSQRVERLLLAGRNVRTNISLGATGAVAALLIASFFILQSVAPSYAFTVTSAPLVAVPENVATKTPAPKHVATTPVRRNAAAPIVRKTIVYIERTPSPRETTIVVPARHIHVPARTIHIPAVNVDVKEQHIHIPAMRHTFNGAFMPLGPDFAKNIQESVDGAMRSAMGRSFHGQDLRGRSFRGQSVSGTDFSRANLQNVDFSSTRLVGSDFNRADARNADFSGAHLTGCDFSNALLTGARFDGAMFMGCDFTGASYGVAQAQAFVRGCSRGGCDLSGANLSGADLRGIRVKALELSGADLRGANLSGSTFTAVDFTNARFDGAVVDGATFVNCSFDGVDLHRVDFSKARRVEGQSTGFP